MPRSEYYQDAGNPVQLAGYPPRARLLALRHLTQVGDAMGQDLASLS